MAEIQLNGENPVCVSFNSPVNNGTAAALMATLGGCLKDGHDDIHLFLSTPGGGVADGITLYNFLQALPVPITTYNIGTVDSIGNVVYQGAGKRFASPSSRFMFHGVGFDIQQARFELKDLNERVKGLKNDQSMIADILVRHSNLSTEDVQKLFLEADFITSEDARERGLVDEVIDIHLPKGLPIRQLVFQG